MSRKTCDIRYNDRDYQLRDILHLREYDGNKGIYTGAECLVSVTHITGFKQQQGMLVMSIRLLAIASDRIDPVPAHQRP